MRRDIVHIGASELHYEICSIADTAYSLENFGLEIYWENIGAPIRKGQKLPTWFKDLVAAAVRRDAVYGYCPTQGDLRTRTFLAEQTNMLNGVTIGPEDIIFFNGLGDAVSKIFGMLKRTARVMVPSPEYMTYAAAEASHAGAGPVPFYLNPMNNWEPDFEDMENRIKYNPSVAAILMVNPDNPTGFVYPQETLRKIIDLAARYDLFLICDEVYHNIVYNNHSCPALAEMIGDVPGIAMKSMSKELPWPGARCGWIEMYNRTSDSSFEKYINSILNAKMLEVCSTTLPQVVLPEIISHPEYESCLAERVARYEQYANISYEVFRETEGLLINPSNGAFYTTVVFEQEKLAPKQTLPIANDRIRNHIEQLCSQPGTSPDTRFTYYLLGATGICVVPLSAFNTDLQGFRITLLENDRDRFQEMITTIRRAITTYLSSA